MSGEDVGDGGTLRRWLSWVVDVEGVDVLNLEWDDVLLPEGRDTIVLRMDWTDSRT